MTIGSLMELCLLALPRKDMKICQRYERIYATYLCVCEYLTQHRANAFAKWLMSHQICLKTYDEDGKVEYKTYSLLHAMVIHVNKNRKQEELFEEGIIYSYTTPSFYNDVFIMVIFRDEVYLFNPDGIDLEKHALKISNGFIGYMKCRGVPVRFPERLVESWIGADK